MKNFILPKASLPFSTIYTRKTTWDTQKLNDFDAATFICTLQKLTCLKWQFNCCILPKAWLFFFQVYTEQNRRKVKWFSHSKYWATELSLFHVETKILSIQHQQVKMDFASGWVFQTLRRATPQSLVWVPWSVLVWVEKRRFCIYSWKKQTSNFQER